MEYGIRLEKTIRTARDRLEQWVGMENRETCLGVYLLDEILDSVESATAAEKRVPKRGKGRKTAKGAKRPGGGESKTTKDLG